MVNILNMPGLDNKANLERLRGDSMRKALNRRAETVRARMAASLLEQAAANTHRTESASGNSQC